MANLLTHCTLIGPIVNCKCCGSMLSLIGLNRPFPSSPGPLFQNEVRCSTFDMEIIFHSHANKTHFHKKGCAPTMGEKILGTINAICLNFSSLPPHPQAKL